MKKSSSYKILSPLLLTSNSNLGFLGYVPGRGILGLLPSPFCSTNTFNYLNSTIISDGIHLF